MRFQPAFLDEIRSRLSVSEVVSKRVKLRRQGREFIGLSPFKQEKTPSFTVNDQKGFYHCFATGEHGDIFTFLIKTEGLSFPEAVERLANECGIPLPEISHEDQQRLSKNEILRNIVSASAKFFIEALQSDQGGQARQYLLERNLSKNQISKFQIGYAPNSRNALKQFLLERGFAIEDIISSGMAIGGQDISIPYDRFRHRIMFPITDLKGQVIAFGGRALDPDQPAKYLNSPETPIFHKGHQLYNSAHARQMAYDKGAIIVAEGYMDVISLDGAGISNTVAPLGTALTENQIQLLWRMAKEPVLCFDGDNAGKKAAFRAVETVLPLLKPGYSLKFAFLPDGQDPDDVIKNEGAAEMQTILAAALPLSNVLWKKEFETGNWSTPERRAALEKQLFSQIELIADKSVRAHYTREIKDRLWRAFQKTSANAKFNNQKSTPRAYRQNKFANDKLRPASTSLKDSRLLKKQPGQVAKQDALILVTLIHHPWLLDTENEHIANLTFSSQMTNKLRDKLLELHITHNSLDTNAIQSHLETLDLHSLAAQMQRIIAQNGPKYAQPNAEPDEVREGWHHLIMRHHKAEELKNELDAAERAFREEDNQQNLDRLIHLNEALNQSLKQVI